VHPGRIISGLYRYLPDDERAPLVEAQPTGPEMTPTKSLEQGAATSVWAATADGIPSGSYLADCQVAEAAPHATDPEEVERIWTWSEEEVTQTFPA
jgi:hypothetical protein